jgi:hypothetical protein
MNRRRIAAAAAFAFALVAVVLAVTPLGGAAIRHVSALIAPTSKSAVAQVNAFNNWNNNGCGSTCSRDGFSLVTHPETGIYCLSGRAIPDHSMLELTADAQHSNVAFPITLMWDRSGPVCGAGVYEVYTYCEGVDLATTAPKAPEGPLCDDVAFFAQAFVRA